MKNLLIIIITLMMVQSTGDINADQYFFNDIASLRHHQTKSTTPRITNSDYMFEYSGDKYIIAHTTDTMYVDANYNNIHQREMNLKIYRFSSKNKYWYDASKTFYKNSYYHPNTEISKKFKIITDNLLKNIEYNASRIMRLDNGSLLLILPHVFLENNPNFDTYREFNYLIFVVLRPNGDGTFNTYTFVPKNKKINENRLYNVTNLTQSKVHYNVNNTFINNIHISDEYLFNSGNELIFQFSDDDVNLLNNNYYKF